MRLSWWQLILVLLIGIFLFVDIPAKVKEIKEIIKELRDDKRV